MQLKRQVNVIEFLVGFISYVIPVWGATFDTGMRRHLWWGATFDTGMRRHLWYRYEAPPVIPVWGATCDTGIFNIASLIS